jgi:hypothetical protein
MSDLTTAFIAISIVGGLYYFWMRCRMFAVSKLLLVMGILIWPLGAIIGIFWGIQDFIKFRANK